MSSPKVICNHSGGKECGNCRHNKPHSINGITPNYEWECVKNEHYCYCANNDMSGAMVQCTTY